MVLSTRPTTTASRSRPGNRAGSRAGSGPGGLPLEALYRDIVGASPRMQRILRLVGKVALTDSTVLLVGESGTGKELVARSLHVQSRRAEGPFVPVHIGAIPEQLIEGELFGHRRGAFTGATEDRPGLLEAADGGTLFLDEVGEMPLPAQVKLLRTIESSEVRRLGENATRVVNLRIVGATHRDLRALVDQGRFREDLYYRMNVVQIEIPPLRERREDIGLLASYFLQRVAERQGKAGVHFSAEAVALLERYDYPGNVRELENAIEHAVTLADGNEIRPADLPPAVRLPRLLPRHDADAPDGSTGLLPEGRAQTMLPGADPRDHLSLADIEREHIRRVLALHRGNATTAARQLGISRTTLWRKLREYGLSRTGSG